MTMTTAFGGLGKVLISYYGCSYLSDYKANSAASSSGFAASQDLPLLHHQMIILASVAFLLTISASWVTTLSFSLATFLSTLTLSNATFKSSFFF